MNELVSSGKFTAMKLEKQRDLFKSYYRLYEARAREFLTVSRAIRDMNPTFPLSFPAPLTKQECQLCCDLLYAYELKAVVPVYEKKKWGVTKPTTSWMVMSQDHMEVIKGCHGTVYIWPIETPPEVYEAYVAPSHRRAFFLV